MSANPFEWDLGDLETIWARRGARLEAVAGLLDRRGATRPRRNTAERDWLAERGGAPTDAGDRHAAERARQHASPGHAPDLNELSGT
jgi:hypothetical protein